MKIQLVLKDLSDDQLLRIAKMDDAFHALADIASRFRAHEKYDEKPVDREMFHQVLEDHGINLDDLWK